MPRGGKRKGAGRKPNAIRPIPSTGRSELPPAVLAQFAAEAKVIIESWRRHYNTIRPHSSLGYKPLAPEALKWLASKPGPASPATPAVAPRLVMH